MQRSYLDYAMSVIVARALPDVRDGLKPVHRRVLYAMYDGGYRPDRGYSKCTRVVGDVMGQYHPHGDSAIYDTLVRLAQPWSLRYRWSTARATSARPATTRRPPCATPSAGSRRSRWRCSATSTRRRSTSRPTTTSAVRSRSSCQAGSPTCSSTAPPASPSAWPPTSRRTTCERLRRPCSGTSRTRTPPTRSCSRRCVERVKGPDFPTGALIVGRDGIADAYAPAAARSACAPSSRSRRTSAAGTSSSSPSCPTRSTRTRSREKIAELVKRGQDRRHRRRQRRVQRAHRAAAGHRAQARRDRQGRAQQPLQAHPAAGLLRRQHARARRRCARARSTRADGAPLRRPPGRGHRPPHPLPAAQGRGARPHPARAAQGARPHRRGHRAHPRQRVGRGRAQRPDVAARDRRDPGHRHPRHAAAPPRRPGAAEAQRRVRRAHAARSPSYEAILASPERQRSIISEELGEIVEQVRRRAAQPGSSPTRATCPSRTSSPKRTSSSRSPAAATPSAPRPTSTARRSRGGKGVQGAQLKQDDIVEHFFVTTTHHWILFFTNKGRVYRAKAHELPETSRAARGQHVANILAFQPDEHIAQVMDIKDYGVAPYLVLATKRGLVKKTALTEFDSNRSGGIVAINLREDDELISASPDVVPSTTCCWSAARPVDPVPRRRRDAAADGSGRHPASSVCGSRRATSCWRWTSSTPARTTGVRPARRDRRRLRQAHPDPRVLRPGPRRQGRLHRQDRRHPWPARWARWWSCRRRRAVRHHLRRRRHPDPAGQVRRAGRQTMGVRLINLPPDADRCRRRAQRRSRRRRRRR